MNLAFRYFTSSTLTVRLTGLNQITVRENIAENLNCFLAKLSFEVHMKDSTSADLRC
jgi:hypothetical protein